MPPPPPAPRLSSLLALALLLPLTRLAAAATLGSSSKFVTVAKDPDTGAWWLQRDGKPFLSLGVSNLNNGGGDDGVGGVLRGPCRAQMGSALCGDTNNWDMVARYSPYNNVTRALFDRSSDEASDEAWAADAAARLEGWGFNTVSGYSSAVAERAVGARGMFYNRLLMFGTRFAEPAGTPLQKTSVGGCFSSDVFSDEFETAAGVGPTRVRAVAGASLATTQLASARAHRAMGGGMRPGQPIAIIVGEQAAGREQQLRARADQQRGLPGARPGLRPRQQRRGNATRGRGWLKRDCRASAIQLHACGAAGGWREWRGGTLDSRGTSSVMQSSNIPM
jgi:hypothetical protein